MRWCLGFLLALAAAAQSPEDRAIAYLEDEVSAWSRSNGCYSCHNNGDGARALYEAVAAVFIANAIGFELTMGNQLVIVLTATLAAIGAAGVPSAGLVTMIIVLEAVGLPAAGYVLVVAVDRILDMCRTTINVWGDAVGAAVVDQWAGEELAE